MWNSAKLLAWPASIHLVHKRSFIQPSKKLSTFFATLYVGDAFLALSDKNLINLEKKVNTQLKFIDEWLRQNKLSLNHSKTTYLLFNTHNYQSINANFLINLNRIK